MGSASRRSIPETVSSTDGVNLRLYDLGGSGPLLLMAHATGFCGTVWGPMADPLTDHFQCVAFDFRAHGRSGRPSERSLEWNGMADDVTAVVQAVSPDQPVLAVGHSMGGAALALAEAATPGLLARAWAFEPILFTQAEPVGSRHPSPISEGARRRRAVFASRDEAFERYGAKPPLADLDPRVLRAYVSDGFRDLADGSVTLSCTPEDECEVFERHGAGALEAAGQLAVPYLVATGSPDVPPANLSIEAANRFSHLELRTYADLTHFGPLEAPERMADECLKWFLPDN